jgi:hypothetical protein
VSVRPSRCTRKARGAAPIPIGSPHRETLQFGDFLDAEAAEYVPLDHLPGTRIEFCELAQALIEREHVRHVARSIGVILVGLGENDFTAPLDGNAAARMIDQHLAHGAGGQRKKMRPVEALLDRPGR